VRSFDRTRDVRIALLATLLIPSSAVLIAMPFRSIARSIDPPGVFAWISLHHVLILILTILVIKFFFRGQLSEWGFNLRESRLSLRFFGSFCAIYLLPVFLYNVLPHLRSGTPPSLDYPLTPVNIGGTLGFRFLLSGTCEEPLYRGLVMTVLARSWRGEIGRGRFTFPISGLWATLFFMLAHVHVSFAPFSVTASFWQQVWALGLGLYYAAAFKRTGSLLAPVLSHGYSNGIISIAQYAMATVMR